MITPGKNRKRCSVDGCDNYVFSSGLCKYHKQYKFEPKKKVSYIKPKSDKQKVKDLLYKDAKAELRAELIEKGEWKCFFTDTELDENHNEFHHLVGRDGDKTYDKKWIVPALNQPHLNYHDLSVEKLNKLPWYDTFLGNLKREYFQLYRKELEKELKK